jgi:MscS family membrane protein
LKSFIDSCNELQTIIMKTHFLDREKPEHQAVRDRILDCIDVSELPEFAREHLAAESAICIKEVLDRIELPPYDEIPDTEAIQEAGGYEALSRWRVPGARITIERVESGPRTHEYLFSPGTVMRARSYFAQLQSLPYRTTGPAVSADLYRWYISSPADPYVAWIVDSFPPWARNQVWGQSLWKWGGLMIGTLVAGGLMIGIYYLQRISVRRVRGKSLFLYVLTIVFPVAAMLIPILFKHFAEKHLTLVGAHIVAVTFAAQFVAILSSLVVVFGVFNRVAAFIIASPHINPQGLDAQFIRIVAKLMSIVVATLVFITGGQHLGIELSTLLASAGIGGLAVALAAQDTLKNVFGTIMLLADKPFRVGERIVFGRYDGVVEDIGLRSTRLRLLTGHQVSIPNDEIARTDVENIGRRPHIRRVADILIPLDTPRPRLEQAVEIIRGALENHEGMDDEFPPRVYFFEFLREAFAIRMIYWYSPPNYWDYLAFSEKLNLRIFEEFEEAGIQFSLPMRLTHTSVESEPKPIEVRIERES